MMSDPILSLQSLRPESRPSPNLVGLKVAGLLVLGPVISVAAGYAVFLVFAFVLGPGFDLEGRATGLKRFFGALAFPGWVMLFTLGLVGSVWKASAIWRGRNF
jgi:hypothetical protein